MAFSSALTITDLNDFLAPGQECIKPVEAPKMLLREPGAAEITIGGDGSYYESGKKLQQAQITLNDCLACSGCITSAESVLVAAQSGDEVLNVTRTLPPGHIVVLSVSPQTLAALASSSSTTLQDTLDRIGTWARSTLRAQAVFDTTFARHISRHETVREFHERKSASTPGPMLAGACPGWVCYAEKTHGAMLPLMSATRSAQAVMGVLVKQWLARKWSKQPSEIYHVTVMPCYDKKLEASRPDFAPDDVREVDCVLSTGELAQLMRDVPADAPPAELVPLDVDLPRLLTHAGTSSGSFLHALLADYAGRNPGAVLTHTERNADWSDYTLADADGTTLFRGATCYGFRNIQNLVRRLKPKHSAVVRRKAATAVADVTAYDFVEVMACPGGCVAGGGQLVKGRSAAKDVEDVYWSIGEDLKALQDAERLMDDIGRDLWGKDTGLRDQLLRTSYKAVESDVVGLGVKW
ncbi:iron hydrogenase [Exidia glandulosa HHB12029]|uniref:Iron hydrogenase n=1 Tax=Exidia glandulosa HHB12029 TaxID=1314781 RepID=A0A166A8S4_EXIGL|nr:iron hydrogenase [Exidia glandulosa HHB12029]